MVSFEFCEEHEWVENNRAKSGRGLPQSKMLARAMVATRGYEGAGVVFGRLCTETVPELEASTGDSWCACAAHGEDARATWIVSPWTAGLKAGVFEAPGFGHAEVLGDTRLLSRVIIKVD